MILLFLIFPIKNHTKIYFIFYRRNWKCVVFSRNAKIETGIACCTFRKLFSTITWLVGVYYTKDGFNKSFTYIIILNPSEKLRFSVNLYGFRLTNFPNYFRLLLYALHMHSVLETCILFELRQRHVISVKWKWKRKTAKLIKYIQCTIYAFYVLGCIGTEFMKKTLCLTKFQSVSWIKHARLSITKNRKFKIIIVLPVGKIISEFFCFSNLWHVLWAIFKDNFLIPFTNLSWCFDLKPALLI